MGFYIRKSIKVGPFRFNLSKSGIGVSAGIKGFRIGTGPRGNHIHVGRYGIYYRATFPSSYSRPTLPKSPPEYPQSISGHELPPGTHEPLREIRSEDVSRIVDSTSEELLNELNQKRQKIRIWPIATGATIVIPFLGYLMGLPIWCLALFLTLGAIGVYVAYQKDLINKTAVIFYEFDPEMEKAYEFLHRSGEQLINCARAWHIEAQGQVLDRKYHAGASSLVRRKSTFIRRTDPPYVKTNIETIAIGLGSRSIHFFPDRILIYDTNGVGAVSYSNMKLNLKQSRFIEDEGLPGDAKVVGQTWKYVNKNGGPDRRFKNNHRIPICLYTEMFLTSPSGLNEIVQLSRCDIGEEFIKSIDSLGSKLPKEASITIS